MPRPRAFALALAAIALIAVGLRLGLLAAAERRSPEALVRPDSREYETAALALATTGRFASGPRPDDPPELRRTPGYPAFLWVLGRLPGGSSRTGRMALQA